MATATATADQGFTALHGLGTAARFLGNLLLAVVTVVFLGTAPGELGTGAPRTRKRAR